MTERAAGGFAGLTSYANPGAGPRGRLARVLSLDDLEAEARRHLPRPVFGYVSGAAEENLTQADNRTAFARARFRPRVLRDVGRRSIQTPLFGRTWSGPFGIAPMGLAALAAYRGDIAMARAAASAGVPMALSGSSLIPLEDVAQAAPGTWFQAYLPGTVGEIDALLDRALAAGYETLIVTVDVPVAGNRENLIRTGFSTPLRPSLRLAWEGVSHPRWLWGTAFRTLRHHGMPHFENSFARRGAPILARNVLRDFSARDRFDWSHVAHIRAKWPGTFLLKGILHPDDAVEAARQGVDGVIVSTHGGRQLDGALAAFDALEAVAAAVPELPVMMDSGVRRGADVVKALALGARFVFIGRPMLYAAAIGGERGVAHALAILASEVDRTLALLGLNGIDEIDASVLVR